MRTLPGAEGRPLVLYDGTCGLCDRAVQFVLRRDRRAWFRFAPLQASESAALLRAHDLDPDDLDSMVLIDERGRAAVESTAALRTVARLGLPWSVAGAFLLVPRFLRDPCYRFVARRRMRWFGAVDACRLPSPEQRRRFLAEVPVEPSGGPGADRSSSAPTPAG